MYQLNQFNKILRQSDGAVIPADPANSDYQAYLGWVAAGNAPLPPAVEPPLVPQSVSMRQARLALLGIGLLDDVDVAIAGIADPIQKRKAQIEWEFGNEVQRNNGIVSMLAPALGLTESQMDQLFVTAATL